MPFCLLGEYIPGTLCCVKGKSSIPRQHVVLSPEAGGEGLFPAGAVALDHEGLNLALRHTNCVTLKNILGTIVPHSPQL